MTIGLTSLCHGPFLNQRLWLLDSASGSVLKSEALTAYLKYGQYCQNNRGPKLASAEAVEPKPWIQKRAIRAICPAENLFHNNGKSPSAQPKVGSTEGAINGLYRVRRKAGIRGGN